MLIVNFPVALPWAAANATTILQMTHASQELGNALADVLFGDANPGGRLVQTWPRSLDQLPPMMDYDLRHGRTYMYFRGEPQYPFGYGLSYTTFAYANLRTSAPSLARGGAIDVSVDVTNTGARAGDEVVQLYVRYPESKVDRPLKQLRGFQRVALAPGETRTVALRLPGGGPRLLGRRAPRLDRRARPRRGDGRPLVGRRGPEAPADGRRDALGRRRHGDWTPRPPSYSATLALSDSESPRSI